MAGRDRPPLRDELVKRDGAWLISKRRRIE
jgi:hypothetical protein